jgi:CheY-like chemotaxis protein
VELPAEPSGAAASEGPDTEIPEFADTGGTGDTIVLNGLDVLVVEDDPEAIEMMNVVLSDRGVLVRTARDYEAALQELQRSWPDVLVSDIGLPGRDGYELVRRVRELETERGHQRLPVIALTAFARVQDRQKTLDSGFDLHLAKPLKPHVLLEAIANCRRT